MGPFTAPSQSIVNPVYFAQHVVRMWNLLPQRVVEANYEDKLKGRLDMYMKEKERDFKGSFFLKVIDWLDVTTLVQRFSAESAPSAQ